MDERVPRLDLALQAWLRTREEVAPQLPEERQIGERRRGTDGEAVSCDERLHRVEGAREIGLELLGWVPPDALMVEDLLQIGPDAGLEGLLDLARKLLDEIRDRRLAPELQVAVEPVEVERLVGPLLDHVHLRSGICVRGNERRVRMTLLEEVGDRGGVLEPLAAVVEHRQLSRLGQRGQPLRALQPADLYD